MAKRRKVTDNCIICDRVTFYRTFCLPCSGELSVLDVHFRKKLENKLIEKDNG